MMTAMNKWAYPMAVPRERINGVLEERIGIAVRGLSELSRKRDGANGGEATYLTRMFHLLNDLRLKGHV